MDIYLEVYTTLIDLERLIKTENLKTAREFGPLSDISHGQGRILAFLKNREPISIKELAQELKIRPQSLNDHLRRMERDGLIKKEVSPEDKRIVLISLTEEAYNIDLDYKNFESIFDGFSQEDLEQFEEYLKKLEINLENELGDESIVEPPRPPHPTQHDLKPPHPRAPGISPPRPPHPPIHNERPIRPPVEPGTPFPMSEPEPPRPEFLENDVPIPIEEQFNQEMEQPIKFDENLKEFVIETVNELLESLKNEGLEKEDNE